MNPNDQITLRALRYFNNNRNEIKTGQGLREFLELSRDEELNNLIHDLKDKSKFICLSDDGRSYEMTGKGELKINELQKFQDDHFDYKNFIIETVEYIKTKEAGEKKYIDIKELWDKWSIPTGFQLTLRNKLFSNGLVRHQTDDLWKVQPTTKGLLSDYKQINQDGDERNLYEYLEKRLKVLGVVIGLPAAIYYALMAFNLLVEIAEKLSLPLPSGAFL